jgi:nucleotide-binding universal stress UspA family protein
MDRSVLVPLDGSAAAETILAHVGAIAPTMAGDVLLFRVLEPPSDAAPDVDWRLQRAECAAYLTAVAEHLARPDLTVRTEVATGTAAGEIVRRASDEGVALVALTTHGRGEAHAFDLGGTSHKVVSRAPTSVLVVHHDPRAPADQPVAYRHVLLPVDGSPACTWALGRASAIAARHGATLHLLHLVPRTAAAHEGLPPSDEERDLTDRLEALQRDRGERYLAAMATKLAHTGLEVVRHLATDDQPAEGILTLARDVGADLIVLAAHGAGGAPWPYGAVAQRLLVASPVPVLVFQDAPKAHDRGATPARP